MYVKSGETTEWDDILIKKGLRTKEEVLIGKGLNPDDVNIISDVNIDRCLIFYWYISLRRSRQK